MSLLLLTMDVSPMTAAWFLTANTGSTTTPPTTTPTNMVTYPCYHSVLLNWMSHKHKLKMILWGLLFKIHFQIAASSGSAALTVPAWIFALSVRCPARVQTASWILTAGEYKVSSKHQTVTTLLQVCVPWWPRVWLARQCQLHQRHSLRH